MRATLPAGELRCWGVLGKELAGGEGGRGETGWRGEETQGLGGGETGGLGEAA